MIKDVYQINLDTDILVALRDKVNEQQHITINKIYGNHRAWDKICAIMDRLDDTVGYLNELKLNTGKYQRSAFDFFEFINNASVVVDCILDLAKIFQVPDEKITNSTMIFNQPGQDGMGTDKRYFEYLRSLCSVHPVGTDRHKRYQDSAFECSPYVMWSNRGMGFNNDSELTAIVYTSEDGAFNKRVNIYIHKIFEYIENRLEFVKEIIHAIDQYQKDVISNFKKSPIKKEYEFDNYIEYLKNLDLELKNRYGSEAYHPFNYIINLFELKVSNPENQNKMSLYQNALKYAIGFEHNRLQNMSYEGFENNGLLSTPKNTEPTLYFELYSPYSRSEKQRKYSYNLEKVSYLNSDEIEGDGDRDWAYQKLKEALPFLENYVSFQRANGDFEHYALVQLALYLECLENTCVINKNIPNDLKYRSRLLLVDEISELHSDK
ncbi:MULTISPECIES: hypothetical protein [Bacillus cereus group]|uniref:Uncharacterized protein n=1 Tax=Bacillus cereus TaxID=1396 RepID=A0A5B9HUI1_BACCE|nr:MULTISPECIES: hypothetical protein [Bacillus cereus group]MEC1983145.1 hypothetical protein [Bacillus cereus]EJR35134.1 hypothetical protein IIE_02776 [Bacillus cereus VD045]MDY8163447.1 hypothetical protein [Bacillus thuringiensis]QEF16830.1 hypothetical protein FRY47_10740 [Bacillus cereus]HDR4348148.1 hypothetical protein [Bacillus cereus]